LARPRLWAGALALAAALPSCTGASIVIVADGDLRPGTDLDSLEWKVMLPDGQARAARHVLGSGDRLPQSLEIVAGEDTPSTVVASLTAFLGGEQVIEASRPVVFQQRSRVEERICLWRGCIGRSDDDCFLGRCLEPAVDGDADADLDSGDAGSDAEADVEADGEGVPAALPGSLCRCDDDCASVGELRAICVMGICMTRASGSCSGGSRVGCDELSRCWVDGSFSELGGICWPDCDDYECAGVCDRTGACAAGPRNSCDPSCGSACEP
jgi:hypothetical protein